MRKILKSAIAAAIYLMGLAIGVFADDLDRNPADSSAFQTGPTLSKSLLPFVIYDSDIGFGFGARAVIKQLESKKSYDLIVFGSTLGEQWYAFTFSAPDGSLRQGTLYPIAFDITIEYDRLLKSNFFGMGNFTADNENRFPRESFNIRGAFSRAFLKTASGALTLRLSHLSAYDYGIDWPGGIANTAGIGESQLLAFGGGINYDSRDNVINPGRGYRAVITVERAVKLGGFDWGFWKGRLELSGYQTIMRKNNVLAARLWMQNVSPGAPFQELSKIGDGWTARGYKAGRFLDRAMTLASLEYRFPIYGRLGGVAFIDGGRVWRSLRKFGFQNWHGDWGGGLRYYLANFVGRIDIGRSPEGVRLYFNFGHVF